MISKLQAFYKSKPWETLVQMIRAERTTPDGFIICEHCGKKIVNRYDCIAHHIIELTDDNVDDVNISLNPDNIALICFRCHNAEHGRFGYTPRKRVYIVYGAPCSGKSTFVRESATPHDIVLDIDKLWQAIRSPNLGSYAKPTELKQNVFALRDTMLDMIAVRRGKWHTAYVIGGYPISTEREQLAAKLNANDCIYINTPREVCEARAKAERPHDWLGFVADWFDRYTPPSDRFT